MLFNSFEFAVFLPLVFVVYWLINKGNLRIQNLFIVSISYFFYGWWDWRFLILIIATSLTTYYTGILINRFNDNRFISRFFTGLNIGFNLAILCLFKYFDFFTENIARLLKVFGFGLDWVTLDILLPVGISFYTFQALSYTIDIYKRKINPTTDIICFLAFVSFFPQLVAGPIERATNLLPQFEHERTFKYNNAIIGMELITWGLFKKVIVADNCAIVVNSIFDNYNQFNGATLLIGAILFSFQIYGDFSGYSDIAIGTAKLFGFNLMRNFNYPYFAESIADFWRRWHISLTTWFRDYIYIPLGGSRCSKSRVITNTFIVFITSGLWHGANWTFIVWGIYHAFLFLPHIILKNNSIFVIRSHQLISTSIIQAFKIISTFSFVVIGWIIFRSETISDAWQYIRIVCSSSLFNMPQKGPYAASIFCGIMLAIEWITKNRTYKIIKQSEYSKYYQSAFYTIIISLIMYFSGEIQTFIYFQF